jgi:Protein of unknown function (DUF3082)
MTDPSPEPKPVNTEPEKQPVTVWRCLSGAAISGPLAIALYFLTAAIAQTFAEKPLQTTSTIALNISLAVRTLVVGAAALGTGVFGFVTLGLIALGIQTAIQQWKPPKSKTD